MGIFTSEKGGGMKAAVGMRIKLIHMEDPYPLQPGATGTVVNIDCNGDLEVAWDCGSSLKLIPGVDRWEAIHETDSDLSSFPADAHRSG